MLRASLEQPSRVLSALLATFLLALVVPALFNGRGRIGADGAPSKQVSRQVWPAVHCMGHFAMTAYCLTIDVDTTHERFLEHDCHWKTAGDRMKVPYWQLTWDSEATSYKTGDSKMGQYCTSGDWTAFRVGPFTTTGGFSWGTMGAVFDSSYFPYSGMTVQGDQLMQPEIRKPAGPQGIHAFTHQSMGNMADDNTVIGYPPIHQHHFHFEGGLGIGSPGYLNNHGDNQCHEQEGGVRCLMHVAPKGTAYVLGDTVNLLTEFNDVRFNGTAPLTSWVFVSFKCVHPSTVRQLTQYVLTVFDDDLAASRYTYELQTNDNSVGWSYEELPFDLNEVTEVYLHSHPPVIEDFWVFQGTPEMVFSNLTAAGPQFHLVYGESVLADTNENIKRRMLEPNPAVLACSYKTAGRVEHICDASVCQDFTRKARCGMNPGISKGIVLVAMHKRIDSGPYRVHNIFRAFYKLPAGKYVTNKNVNDVDEFAYIQSHHMSRDVLGVEGYYRIWGYEGV